MHNLIYNEWVKIFKRVGTYVMIGLIIVGVILMGTIQKVYLDKTNENNTNWKTEVSAQIKNDEENLKHTPKIAQNFTKQQIEVNKYRLEHNIPPETGSSMYSFIDDSSGLITFAGLFTIIIAASIVASEFGWGTIKLLLIRPIKRSKILLSKYLTVVLFGVLITAILFGSAALIGVILFGTGSGENIHLAYTNGHVVEQSILLFLVKKFLLSSINVLMLATMAFMVSAVFRNSSLAIGIAIFLLVMGSNATTILAVKFDWVKYILFANTDLMRYVDGVPLVEGMTLGFSITMLIIYFVIFQVLAFTVFTKRDVAA
ncbi:ABC transporter permease [Bacillus sp. FJAT-49736]|uniref:ABC transporter permease n=1 Tax=Bacillus sp. FJAT-49736 TaxID=2833582 RepID=UPI001BC9C643|nr:ABC transporter permease [Bacillus sp. FJAT-49736]MBS4173650.1 ABC transporter permease [Bacillus sp. FJAT-49736]